MGVHGGPWGPCSPRNSYLYELRTGGVRSATREQIFKERSGIGTGHGGRAQFPTHTYIVQQSLWNVNTFGSWELGVWDGGQSLLHGIPLVSAPAHGG